MNAAEVLAAHRKRWTNTLATCSGCDWSRFGNITRTDEFHAAHQVAALKAAGYEVVAVPVGGWVASMTPVDPVAGEGNFMAPNGQWYRADDATEARS